MDDNVGSPTKKRSNIWLLILIATFVVATGNATFYRHVVEVYPWQIHGGFLLSLTVFLISGLVFLMGVFHLLLPFRVTAGLFLISAATVGHFSDQFGIIINTEMIQNVLETDPKEAADLINGELLLRLGLLGLLPTVIVGYLAQTHERWLVEKGRTLLTILASLIVVLACFFIHSDQYSSFFREHKPLRYYANPIYPLFSIGKTVARATRSHEKRPLEIMVNQATMTKNDAEHELVILVVGETARADHFSLNGYDRPTNPRLAKEERLINYPEISSCGTSTAYSVPCMFSFLTRKEFSRSAANGQENVLDVLAKAGVSVLWRDNNSSSKGVADRVRYEDFKSPELNPICEPECRDTGMLPDLQGYINDHPQDILIVLHQMGNHGPAYYKRYPPEFEQFKPACQTNELSECSNQEIINAYDNALLYTDYFLSEVIHLLKANSPAFETTLIYVSDHGESLGENFLYLHGLPYSIAPKEQTHVPMVIWTDPSSDIDYPRTQALASQENSHDALARTLLELFEVKTDLDEKLAEVEPLLLFR